MMHRDIFVGTKNRPRDKTRIRALISRHWHTTALSLIACPIVLAFSMETSAAASPNPVTRLHFATVALPPYAAMNNEPGVVERLVHEAFHRLDMEIDVTVLPGERSLINANQGLDDGDLMRAPGFEKDYPNLIKVPEKIDDMEFVGYTQRQDIKIQRWEDLQPYTVAYPTGWKIYDRNVKAKEVVTVRTIPGLFSLLDQKRVDIVLADRAQGLYAARAGGHSVRLLEPPLAASPMFIYLNKKHASLVPRLTSVLVAMKHDGTYNHLYQTTMKSILSTH